ncbi:MAG: hypothetical protein CMJ65_07420 [Planctomycetaceae bacterium]|nr:hypothetical protein [Planctomycetaceae bacterium]
MFKLSKTRCEIWWILFPMWRQFVRRDSRRPARRLTNTRGRLTQQRPILLPVRGTDARCERAKLKEHSDGFESDEGG